MKENSIQKKMTSGIIWSFGERIASQTVSTIVTIILARILDPIHYGIISIVSIFISFCDIFVTDGFGKVLVQKKEADETDFNSMFWLSLLLSIILYSILFISAPYIEAFYQLGTLSITIRILGLRLILTSINTIQQANVQRRMEFRKFFVATFWGTSISAVIGIFMAYRGFGVWALVAQYLSNTAINTITLYLICDWHIHFEYSWDRVKAMLPFSWRVLVQSIIYTAEDNVRSLIIGKGFGSVDLAYYNKGVQFPQLIITNLNTAIGKVLLPAIASNQDDPEQSKRILRRSVSIGMYILCPAMIGFCAVADTFVSIVLTDKWLPCVPYLQILCIVYLTRPFETTCSSAILALGRSDVTLKNMIIINAAALVTVFIAVFLLKSVLWIAYGRLLTVIVSVALHSRNVHYLIQYNYAEQLKDCGPSVLLSGIMALAVYWMRGIQNSKAVVLLIQVAAGLLIYIVLSAVFRVKSYMYIKTQIKSALKGIR